MTSIEGQLANLTQAVALGGGQRRAILQRIAALEADRLPLEMQARELAARVKASRRK